MPLGEVTLAWRELRRRWLVQVVEDIWILPLQALLALRDFRLHVHDRIVPIFRVLVVGLRDCLARVRVSATFFGLVGLLCSGCCDSAPICLALV